MIAIDVYLFTSIVMYIIRSYIILSICILLTSVNMQDCFRYMKCKIDTRHYCRYAKTLNIVFNPIFFVQFFSSILVICTSVFYLSRHITESESATFIVYTICMFVQIYIYCWSGNEVIFKVKNRFCFTLF